MNPQDIFIRVLMRIRTKFYAAREREFWRDHQALLKAVARYSAECHKRGWDLEPDAICEDLMTVVDRIMKNSGEVPYFPSYLERAVANHVGYRSEEIRARSMATRTPRAVSFVMHGLERVAVVQPSTTELCDSLYKSLVAKRRQRRLDARAEKPAVQLTLL